jgi:hypothetical protein
LHSMLAFMAHFFLRLAQRLWRRSAGWWLGCLAARRAAYTLDEAGALKDLYVFRVQVARLEETALATKLRVNTWEAHKAGWAPLRSPVGS